MNREPQSGSDSTAVAGLLERPPATTASLHVHGAIAARGGQLAAEVLSFPDFRSARVKALKAQIAAGTYNVPAPKVAAALLDSMLERERVDAGSTVARTPAAPRLITLPAKIFHFDFHFDFDFHFSFQRPGVPGHAAAAYNRPRVHASLIWIG